MLEVLYLFDDMPFSIPDIERQRIAARKRVCAASMAGVIRPERHLYHVQDAVVHHAPCSVLVVRK